jgi:hypothetical protein
MNVKLLFAKLDATGISISVTSTELLQGCYRADARGH